jgi:hypothetical protein
MSTPLRPTWLRRASITTQLPVGTHSLTVTFVPDASTAFASSASVAVSFLLDCLKLRFGTAPAEIGALLA